MESIGGEANNIDKLSQALEDAMAKFMKAQELKITELEAPYNILPGKINVNTAGSAVAQSGVNAKPVKGIVQISETSNKVMDGKVPKGVNKSKVVVKKVKGLG